MSSVRARSLQAALAEERQLQIVGAINALIARLAERAVQVPDRRV